MRSLCKKVQELTYGMIMKGWKGLHGLVRGSGKMVDAK